MSSRNLGIAVAALAALLGRARAQDQAPSTNGPSPIRVEVYQPGAYVRGVTQTRDGRLWIGTDAGLLRFDGTRLVASDTAPGGRPLTAGVKAVHGASDGALWIALADGGVLRLEHGRTTEVLAPQSGRWVERIVENTGPGPLAAGFRSRAALAGR